MDLSLQNKIDYFSELITCSHNIRYWCYDSALNLLSADFPEESVYDSLFSVSGCKDYLHNYSLTATATDTLVMSDTAGLMWIAAFENDQNHIARIHMIGPVFIADVSVHMLEKYLAQKNYSFKIKNTFLNTLRTLPILSVTTLFQYGQMLHFTITGEKISVSDFHFQLPDTTSSNKKELDIKLNSSKESHGTWAAEQEMVRMVEEGNLNYQEVFDKLAVTGSSAMFHFGDPIRQAKDFGLTFTVLCSRAAMRGGLSPELSYTLSDYYFQDLEASHSLPQIQEICHTMYQDYITRVHDLKKNTHISSPIHESCSYIQIHSAEKLNISDIAAQVGYTEYYFSKKFKKEMGLTVKDYIKDIKVQRAKIMLKSETASIQDISDSLSFCTQSYFTETFNKITGMTPGEYRNQS